jgi:pSer/pThr/pTyr-binding forkhead associated (FHA) protein
MPQLRLNDTTFELHAGEMRVGTGTDADIRLPDDGSSTVLLIVSTGADGTSVRRASPDAPALVNGVPLGAEPAPLIHGDKIDIGTSQLRFADEAQTGMTRTVPSFVSDDAPGPRRVERRAPAMSGGRLVSLVDGREYPILQKGVRIGRDASCDIVVPSSDVSRKHAEIIPGSQGYVLKDLSTNGVYVNGERTQSARVLIRGDLIRVGKEEFRFHGDSAATAVPPAGTPPPLGAAAPIATPPRTDRKSIATLEIVNEGVLKGTRFEIQSPLTHIGRGAHNDVIVPDESVSDSHAKLQKREHAWVVVDMDSTNGTYVAGQRISGERPISGTVDVRFGGIKMMFRPAAEAIDLAGGTRVIVGLKAPDPKRAVDTERVEAAPAPPKPAAPAPSSTRISPFLWIAALVLVAAIIFILMQGR